MAVRCEYRAGNTQESAAPSESEIVRLTRQLAALGALAERLERQGVLRLIGDLSGGAPEILEIGLRGLNSEGGRNALQNLILLARELGRIPPADMQRMLAALREGLRPMVEPADGTPAPGLRGFYRLLSDDALWQALEPALRGMQAFRKTLPQPAKGHDA